MITFTARLLIQMKGQMSQEHLPIVHLQKKYLRIKVINKSLKPLKRLIWKR